MMVNKLNDPKSKLTTKLPAVYEGMTTSLFLAIPTTTLKQKTTYYNIVLSKSYEVDNVHHI